MKGIGRGGYLRAHFSLLVSMSAWPVSFVFLHFPPCFERFFNRHLGSMFAVSCVLPLENDGTWPYGERVCFTVTGGRTRLLSEKIKPRKTCSFTVICRVVTDMLNNLDGVSEALPSI